MVFNDLEIKAHNLRNDMLKEGTITALDVILTLGEDNKLTYDLQWRDSIGSAGIVRNFWIERINGDKASGRCGFVYEEGPRKFQRSRMNHIHIPSDARILNSPEYVEFYWICI